MRRLLAGSLTVVAFTGTFLVLPVYAEEGPEPEPVTTSSEEIALGSVEDPAPAAEVQEGTTEPVTGVSDTAPTLTVSRTGVDEFSLVGVTWAHDPAVTDTVVQIRAQDADGEWGPWTEVATEDAEQASDAPVGADVRGGTEPLWTGPSTAVEAEVVARSGAQPIDVQLALVDPGESDADGDLGTPDIQDTADAAMAMPDVYSRAQWGADESIMSWGPQHVPTLKAATVHHTANANDYAAGDVAGILRGIYRYHSVTRGWGDIGYNVIVDRFGRLWEGRAGGLSQNIVGAHAGGFNSGTFGVSMLGTYETTAVPQVVTNAVAAIIAWKFSLYNVNPRGTTTLVSGGGSTARYAAGVPVTVPTIFGHRDTNHTTCPGNAGYARLPEVRDRVAAAMATSQTIDGRYSSEPALRTLLGAPVGGRQTTAGVTWQAYQNGRMYSSPTAGVHAVTGDILRAYLAVGGPADIGAPTTDELPTPDRVARFNHFANNASIYWTPTTGAHLVRGTIRTQWGRTGWETGPLGYPVTDELGAPGGIRYSTFQRGSIYWTQATGAHAVSGAIGFLWNNLGGLNWGWGVPTTGELPTPDGVGRFNQFSGGASIYWTQATGAHAVQGDIRTVWSWLGWESGPLRYPTSDEILAPDGRTRYATFQRGAVYWTPQTGAHAVSGAIGDRWFALGGLNWGWGVPIVDETSTPDRSGRYNHFSGGASIYWSASTGAHAVQGDIRTLWGRMGWEAGRLGYPTSDEVLAPDGRTRYTTFQRGAIYWTPETGARAVVDAIADRWHTLGGLNWGWGVPTTDQLTTPDGVGRYNHFSRGASIYWTPATGAHAVQGDIRTRWAAGGWERGLMGYPTSDELGTPDGRARYTTFQNGSVYWTPSGGAKAVQGSIAAAYRGIGAHTSALGLPTSDEYPVPGGRRSDFEHGTITWTAATGATTVTPR